MFCENPCFIEPDRIKHKTRFVCKGYSEIYGQDFWNIRSGVVDFSSARMLIALAAAECGPLPPETRF